MVVEKVLPEDKNKSNQIGFFDYIEKQVERERIFTDFVLNILMKSKRGVVVFDELLFKSNVFPFDFKSLKYNRFAIRDGYAEVIKETENYIKLKITESGRNHFSIISEKYLVYLPSMIDRTIWLITKNIPTLDQIINYAKIFWKYFRNMVAGTAIVLGGILAFFELRPHLSKLRQEVENSSQTDQPLQNDKSSVHADSTNVSSSDSLYVE